VNDLAPRFRAALYRALEQHRRAGHDSVIFETIRTNERQRWLYGFNRDYDDGRGQVTGARTADLSWHIYGLAADVISRSKGWDASAAFWRDLGSAARDEGLAWGGDWLRKDLPHIQWGKPMRDTPSVRAVKLRRQGGNPAVWREVLAHG
jgi:hypothetical protein